MEGNPDRADLRRTGGSHDGAENLGTRYQGRTLYGNGILRGRLYLCGDRGLWPDHDCIGKRMAGGCGSVPGNTGSMGTETEGMSESAITDETESMTGLAADAGEAESETVTAPETAAESETASVPETALETTGTETGTRNGAREENVMNMNVQVGDAVFSATLEENEAVTAFVEMMREGSVVIQMSDYSGFEKVGSLGTSLPTSNKQTTTQSGDIVLYNGNQIVIFYGSNSWSYTRLGRIDDLSGWEDALGSGDVTVTFSLK